MQLNILCILTLLVAFVASAAVPEVAPDVTSTSGTWFDVEDFDATDFSFATRDEDETNSGSFNEDDDETVEIQDKRCRHRRCRYDSQCCHTDQCALGSCMGPGKWP
ncbi:hypothetical protein AbraIFM66951_006056 [Aspergillus brasiliensis]|uniref:Uncharacterized protein n=1 Tax=Aspergillus brasiliensis TaxID=319629 RepID=A0A9W6DRM8_9EURO|nr:hypothetical protein AbraCBS73388_011372 [Aspergillus brasiliensis]GKZ44216.1 hypothetical protein AbraIFM66951_006056 [Aspergillus brasiliensis]